MTISWISKPGFSSIMITLFVALQISACSTEEFAEAVADNIVSNTSYTSDPADKNTADITNTSDTTTDSNSGTTTTDTTTDSNSDSTTTDTNAPDPIPDTVADINLTWVAPAEREDNQPISLSEIAGYKIYYGTTQGKYPNSINVNDGSASSYTLNNFTEGTYYFVVTTYDTEGRESQYSSVLTVTI